MDADRDMAHRLPSGGTLPETVAPDGRKVAGRHEFRFAQGLRRDHAAALDARPDLCARLWGAGLWGVTPDELDEAICAMLAETAA